MATAQRTRDHETIRRWAEERGGVAALVKGSGSKLRIDFVEGTGGLEPRLRVIAWDEWFRVFDELGFYFLYSPEPENRFFALVSGEADECEGAVA